jgi:membrane-associated phospholipid phosphatase
MQALTDFADLAVVLPVALCVGVWLAVSGWANGARAWLLAFGAVLGVTTVLKLVFLGCAPADSPISSPSGHTASSSFVYGGLATLAVRAGWKASAALGIAVAALVGVSRVAVHAHSGAEAMLGGLVGVAAVLLFAWRAGPVPRGLRIGRLLLACLPLIFLLHGTRLNAEPHVRGVAFWLGRALCKPASWNIRPAAS